MSALLDGRSADALDELREARQDYDFWFAHFLLGRAFFEAGHFPEALDEFDYCVRDRGEITDVFLVDSATLRYFPPALYWLGRCHEALGNSDAARGLYEEYVALRVGADPPDELAADAAARLRKLRTQLPLRFTTFDVKVASPFALMTTKNGAAGAAPFGSNQIENRLS